MSYTILRKGGGNIEKDNVFEKDILRILPLKMRESLYGIFDENVKKHLEEINIRINRPVILRLSDYNGRREILTDFMVTDEILKETVGYISNFSLYAYEDQVKEGFLTIKGGHRIGISGKTIMSGRDVKTIKNITSLNIRIARQIKGCANDVMENIMKSDFDNTLIISPPCMGKTTLLREMVRLLSDKYKYKIGLVDERGEIAACHMGIPQNDIGQRCDVMDGCKKDIGLMMLVRSMSPDIIAVDELGSESDIEAIKMAGNYGGKIIGTIHGNSITSIANKKFMKDLIEEKFFKNYIIIQKSRIAKIFDENGKCYDKDCRLFNDNIRNYTDGF